MRQCLALLSHRRAEVSCDAHRGRPTGLSCARGSEESKLPCGRCSTLQAGMSNRFHPFFNNFIYCRLCWVFVTVCRHSLVAASGAYSLLWCTGFSLHRLLLLQIRGAQTSVVEVRGLRCSAACGTFLDQGSNPCTLPWQVDCHPLYHQGSPCWSYF